MYNNPFKYFQQLHSHLPCTRMRTTENELKETVSKLYNMLCTDVGQKSKRRKMQNSFISFIYSIFCLSQDSAFYFLFVPNVFTSFQFSAMHPLSHLFPSATNRTAQSVLECHCVVCSTNDLLLDRNLPILRVEFVECFVPVPLR